MSTSKFIKKNKKGECVIMDKASLLKQLRIEDKARKDRKKEKKALIPKKPRVIVFEHPRVPVAIPIAAIPVIPAVGKHEPPKPVIRPKTKKLVDIDLMNDLQEADDFAEKLRLERLAKSKPKKSNLRKTIDRIKSKTTTLHIMDDETLIPPAKLSKSNTTNTNIPPAETLTYPNPLIDAAHVMFRKEKEKEKAKEREEIMQSNLEFARLDREARGKEKESKALFEKRKKNSLAKIALFRTMGESPKELRIMLDEHKEQYGSGGVPEDGLSEDQLNEMVPVLDPMYVKTIASDEMDMMPKGKSFSCIINNQKRVNGGQHWRALRCDFKENTCEFYDPFGSISPANHGELNDRELVALKKLTNSNPKMMKMKQNTVQNQLVTSDNCGWICMEFLKNRANGESFKEATNYVEPDEDFSQKTEAEIIDLKKKFKTFI